MHLNENLAPRFFLDENSMHEIEHRQISLENILGKKIIPGNFGGKIFLFMLRYIIAIHEKEIENEIFMSRFFDARKLLYMQLCVPRVAFLANTAATSSVVAISITETTLLHGGQ